MGEYICKCYRCKIQDIKRSEMVEGVDYIHHGTRYYHKKCYDDWKKSRPLDDEEYVELIYDFLSSDLKVSYDYHMCEAQRKKFIKENKMTNKGILFALKYFYEVKSGDWEKGHGGIGIVPFVYNDSCAYWAALEYKSRGLIKQIEKQMKEAAERNKKVVHKKETKKKSKFSLSSIAEMEDEE